MIFKGPSQPKAFCASERECHISKTKLSACSGLVLSACTRAGVGDTLMVGTQALSTLPYFTFWAFCPSLCLLAMNRKHHRIPSC